MRFKIFNIFLSDSLACIIENPVDETTSFRFRFAHMVNILSAMIESLGQSMRRNKMLYQNLTILKIIFSVSFW